MTEPAAFGSELSRWPDTRQNWAITTPPVSGSPGVYNMPMPTAPPPSGWPPLNSTSPPGLESLMPLDHIFINQRIEAMEVMTGFQGKNRYAIMDANAQHLFDLYEDSSFFSRLCCGSSRQFEIKVLDRSKQEVLRLCRPTELCLGELEVYSGNTRLGSIHEKCRLRPEFDICNEYGNVVLQIGGPLCHCECFGPRQFEIFSGDASRKVGLITKNWSGLLQEMFTNADVFGISFPVTLDVKIKAVLLGAAILIDFEYFEQHG